VITIAGHKLDLEKLRQVNRNGAIEYSQKIGALHYETSALNNNGIEDLFENLARHLIQKQKTTQKVPKKDRTLNPYQDNRTQSNCCS